MMTLLPRLPAPAAEILLEQYFVDGFVWPGFDPSHLPPASRWAPTGGSRVPPNHLKALRDRILTIARSNGFETSTTKQTASFDAEMAASLADDELFASGEALRDDVWTFVATAVAPDVVHWRFPELPKRNPHERYLGGIRNTFQRLWMRGRVLDRGTEHGERWQLLVELTEDALVQITERPSLGATPRLARAIAEAWIRGKEHHGRGAMELLMRRAAKRITALNEISSVADLPCGDLVHTLNSVFDLPDEEQLGSRRRTTSVRKQPTFTRTLPEIRQVLAEVGFDAATPEFTDLDFDAQLWAVWCVLTGEGAVPRDARDTVAKVARRLRDQGFAEFERLRMEGRLYGAIAAVLASADQDDTHGLEWPRGPTKRVRAYRPVADMQAYDWRDCVIRVLGSGALESPVVRDLLVLKAFELAKRFYGIRTATGSPCRNLMQETRDQIEAALDWCLAEEYVAIVEAEDGAQYMTLECEYAEP